VKLIVEKEREIIAFKPVESWKIKIQLDFNGSKFEAIFSKVDGKVKKLHSQEDVQKVLSTLVDDISSLKEGKSKKDTIEFSHKSSLDFKLVESIKKDSKRSPGAPFTTSTLQQE
jgi:DNA topoisomerase-1